MKEASPRCITSSAKPRNTATSRAARESLTIMSAQNMKTVLKEIQTGEFAKEWILENQAGRPQYSKLLDRDANHRIEKVGKELRAQMSWLKPERPPRERERSEIVNGIAVARAALCATFASPAMPRASEACRFRNYKFMPKPLPFRRVAILGTGLIGGSFALALREHFPDVVTVGYDRPDRTRTRPRARRRRTNPPPILRPPFAAPILIYMALPIGATIESLAAIAASAERGCSGHRCRQHKSCDLQNGQRAFPAVARNFSAGIPMAGKEHSGVEHADAELFRGAHYVLIGPEENSSERVEEFAESVRAIGARAFVVLMPIRTIGPSESFRICRSLLPWRSRAWCRMKPTKPACRCQPCGAWTTRYAAACGKPLRCMAGYFAHEQRQRFARARPAGPSRRPSSDEPRAERTSSRNFSPRTNFTNFCETPVV